MKKKTIYMFLGYLDYVWLLKILPIHNRDVIQYFLWLQKILAIHNLGDTRDYFELQEILEIFYLGIT